VRIALISTPFIRVPPAGYGGTELFCWELSEQLIARGHEVTLFTTGDSTTSGDKRWLYPFAVWPPSPHDEMNHVAWAMAEVSRGSYDVVHANSPLAVALARFTSVPLVYTLHHHRTEPLSRLYSANQRASFVAISQRQLELEVALADATVIHHGLDARRYPPSDHDEGYLLHLGRYAEQKGTHLAIDVATLADLPIKLAGRIHEEDEAYFREHVAPRLERRGVFEVGEAAHARKVALLRGARALIAPLTWEEPFGLVAVEAMLSGTPVLGFARGSFPEIVDEGVTGFLAPPGHVEALAAIAPRLAGFDRRACARRARERFRAEVMAEAYERVYAHAARLRSPAPFRRSSSGR